jgi:hypothetical protein
MANVLCASSEFDVFADRPVQSSTVRTVEIDHKPTTAIGQRDIEFTGPASDESQYAVIY